MLLIRVISPEGKACTTCAAFPSARGSTEPRDVRPTAILGWRVETSWRRHRSRRPSATTGVFKHQILEAGFFRRRARHVGRVDRT
ncbi:MAG: hypothetical protein R2692_00555 [Microbacterium sp.]